jgi:3-hydroxyisobutyrate dehydrogenase-like beta-hydroxyacid dehydrogenase
MPAETKQQTIGLIGLGNMGCPMGLNLLEKGHSLLVYDLRREAAGPLCDAGAVWAGSIKELAENSNTVITILPRDDHVLSVYSGPSGIIASMKDGGVCIEMTSCRGETVRKIARCAGEQKKNMRFLDAPVSGGTVNARSGALTIMAGGERDLYDFCYPLLCDMGKKIFYTGGLGSGKSFKMINQLLNAGNTLVAAEAIFLAQKMELDMDILCGVIKESSGNSWIFENNVQKFMLAEQFDSGFKLELLKKDISLAMDEIRQADLSLPLSALIYQIYQAMENQGEGSKNYNIISRWVRQQNKGKL